LIAASVIVCGKAVQDQCCAALQLDVQLLKTAPCATNCCSCRVGTGYSGWRPSVVSKAYAHTAIKVTNDILRAIKPRGPGGFDFLSGAVNVTS
jgi:hypothetical protein